MKPAGWVVSLAAAWWCCADAGAFGADLYMGSLEFEVLVPRGGVAGADLWHG